MKLKKKNPTTFKCQICSFYMTFSYRKKKNLHPHHIYISWF